MAIARIFPGTRTKDEEKKYFKEENKQKNKENILLVSAI